LVAAHTVIVLHKQTDQSYQTKPLS
jgi:hypothetical protein